MLDAIGHIALVVRDSSRTAALFKDLFGAAITSLSRFHSPRFWKQQKNSSA